MFVFAGINRFNHLAVLLAAAFFLLATAYSLIVPIFEGPDEKLHYPYVKQLADGRGLPVAGRDMLVKQAATQGPLYYALAALVTAGIDSRNMEALLDFNPHWRYTEYRALWHDNQNYVIRSPADRFPYQGAALAVHLSRLVAVFFGAMTVGLTVLLAEELFPGRRWLALGAGSLVAFQPQFVFVSASVSNDSTAAALVALVCWLALRWGRRSLSAWQIVLLGALSGLCVLAKLNGVIGLGLAGLALLYRKPPQLSYRRLAGQWAGLGLVALLVCGWWFWRNWQLYGELTATQIHLDLSQRGYLSYADIVRLWPEVEQTFWAAFGRGQIRVDRWIYLVLRWLKYVAMGGLLIFLLRPRPGQSRLAVALPLIWVGVQLALLFRWFSIIGSASHARLLFPALPAIAILGMLGLGQWLPPRPPWRLGLAGLVSVAMAAFALAGLLVYIRPAYTPPPAIAPTQIPADLPELNLTYAGGLRLVTADLPTTPFRPGETVAVDLYWQAVAPLETNYSVFVRLLAPDGAVIAARDTYPGLGLLPTRNWPPGRLVKDTYPLQLPPQVPQAPLLVEVRAGLFDYNAETRAGLPAVDTTGQVVTPRLGWVKIVPQTWPTVDPDHPLEVRYAEGIILRGYDWHCPDDCLLTLYWQATDRPSAAYTVFIQHWRGGQQVAGFDGPPRQGAYPSDWWAAGEVIVDPHPMPRLTDGSLRLGLYELSSGRRLPILAAPVDHQDQALVIDLPLQ